MISPSPLPAFVRAPALRLAQQTLSFSSTCIARPAQDLQKVFSGFMNDSGAHVEEEFPWHKLRSLKMAQIPHYFELTCPLINC